MDGEDKKEVTRYRPADSGMPIFDRRNIAKESNIYPSKNILIGMKKVDPPILTALQKLGYRKIEVRNDTLHARCGADHFIIKLTRKGTVKLLIQIPLGETSQ